MGTPSKAAKSRRCIVSPMSSPSDPTDRMNANQFDDEGLPGIDKDFPPENSWGVEDPALVNTENAQDNLVTRVAREAASEHETNIEVDPPILMDQNSGDPAVEGDVVDDEPQAVATTGRGDPDAGPTAEEAAMHIIDEFDEPVDQLIDEPVDEP